MSMRKYTIHDRTSLYGQKIESPTEPWIHGRTAKKQVS